jgi:ribosomal protein S13
MEKIFLTKDNKKDLFSFEHEKYVQINNKFEKCEFTTINNHSRVRELTEEEVLEYLNISIKGVDIETNTEVNIEINAFVQKLLNIKEDKKIK